jgi:dihydroorotase
MNILIKSATIIDTQSPFHKKKMDVLIEKGIISEIKQEIKSEKNYKIIEGKKLHVSIGWIDMQASLCDPGYEHKEDLQSGLNAAAYGGFSGVCVMPSTNPPLHSKSQIEYVLNKTNGNIVDVLPIGCITHNHAGKELAEMYDMKTAGAVAFSDHKKEIKDSSLLIKAIQYASNINTLIITHCDDKSVSGEGQMNEGVISTRIGLKGIPALAEEIMLQRNISILE